jgi:hypothetical protein
MNTWYTAAVRYTKEFTDGTLKRTTEKYLLNTMSFTDAEARIYKEVGEYVRGEFQVTALQKTNYADIFFYDDAEIWYNVKLAYVTEDADTGKEKKVTNLFLVSAHNIKEAYERMEESMKGLMAHFTILKIEKSPIIDIFPYEAPEERHEKLIENSKPVGIPVLAKDKESLIAYLDKQIDLEALAEARDKGQDAYYLTVERADDGSVMKWEYAEDVPDFNVYSEKGNPMIIYDSNLEPENVIFNGSESLQEKSSPNINVSYEEAREIETGVESEE